MSKRVLFSRLCVVAATFGAGYRWGLRQTVRQIMKSQDKGGGAQQLLDTTSSSRSSPTTFLLTSVIVLLLFRDGWRSLPAWAKPNIIRRSIQDTKRLLGIQTTASDEDDLDSENISDFNILGGKFRALAKVAQRRMPEEEFQDFNLQESVFALLQLLREQKANRAVTRDERYEACGPSCRVDPALVQWMDLADAAYDELPDDVTLKDYLDEKGYSLIKYDKNTQPGYLGHYVALDKSSKTALIGIKGTSNLEDLITDMVGAATSFDLPEPFIENGPTTIRAHEGILQSSRRLADA